MSEKYEWSESGKKLLQTIVDEIQGLGGMSPTYHIILTENSPVYKHKAAANKFFYYRYKNARRSKNIKKKKFFIDYTFTDYELSVINQNLDLSPTALHKLLPGSTYFRVKAKRLELKYKLKLIKMLLGVS